MRHVNYIYDHPLSRLRPAEHLYDELEQLHLDRARYRLGGEIYLKLTRAIKALRETLRKLERYNEPIRTKWDMLLDPFRRKQVLAELGGEDALGRWEARRARFLTFGRRGRKAKSSERKTVSQARPHKDSGYRRRTDRTGRFYLAPAIEPLVYDRRLESRVRGDAPTKPRARPRIPLTPDELRGDVLMGLGIRPDGANTRPPPRERGRCRNAVKAEGAADSPQARTQRLSAAAPSDPPKKFGAATSPARAVEGNVTTAPRTKGPD